MEPARTSRDCSVQKELAIDLSHLVGKLPSNGYLIITDLPDGARLSQGHDNGDRTWTIFCDEARGLKFLPGDVRGVISLNVLIFNLDPGTKRSARQIPVVLHTDDGVEWIGHEQFVETRKAGRLLCANSAGGQATSPPGDPLKGAELVEATKQPRQLALTTGERRDQRDIMMSMSPPEDADHTRLPSVELVRATRVVTSVTGDRVSGAPVPPLFAEAERRWGAESDHLLRQFMADLRQEAGKVLNEVEQRRTAELKELSDALMKQHEIIAALKLAAEQAKEETAARFSQAKREWEQAEAARLSAAHEAWASREEALTREAERHRATAEQLESALLALKDQSAAKERELQKRHEEIKAESERLLLETRSIWQREVAKSLERAGVQILAVFDRATPSK